MHIDTGRRNTLLGWLKRWTLVRLLGFVLVGGILAGSNLAAAQVLVLDRGLPTANLNNAAQNRSNVLWDDAEIPPQTPWLPGDDFTLPGSGNYTVTTIRVWSKSNTGLTLWGGVAGGPIASVSSVYTATAVTYSNSEGYQKKSDGSFVQLYQIDFSVDIALTGGITYQFFLDGSATSLGDGSFVGASLHASTAALSGSTQQGADGTFLFLDNIAHTVLTWNSGTGGGTCCGGYIGTSENTDGNVQVFAALPPTVTSISPTSGITAGGTSITITGTNLTGATGITVGGTACTTFGVTNATTATCTTPAGTAGAKDVVLTTPGGSATGISLFTYVAAPTVTAVNPIGGPTAGGTSVTITGTDLSSATGVTIGGNACAPLSAKTATSVTCTTAAHAAGTTSVLVTTVGGTNSANTLFAYTVRQTPAINTAGGGGTVVAQIVNGSAGCSIDLNNTTAFTPPSFNGTTPPYGGLKLKLTGCNSGETVQVSTTWPNMAGLTFQKYGPTPTSSGASIYYTPNGMSVAGNTVTYSITDNGLGDDTFTGADGVITDPAVPVSFVATAAGIPTLSEWGLIVLSGLLALGTLVVMRRRQT